MRLDRDISSAIVACRSSDTLFSRSALAFRFAAAVVSGASVGLVNGSFVRPTAVGCGGNEECRSLFSRPTMSAALVSSTSFPPLGEEPVAGVGGSRRFWRTAGRLCSLGGGDVAWRRRAGGIDVAAAAVTEVVVVMSAVVTVVVVVVVVVVVETGLAAVGAGVGVGEGR